MEYLDIVDENGNPTGQTIARDEAHRIGACHRTVHIWIIRESQGGTMVLLQKRSAEKESFPGCWDISAAGHISAGDEPLLSAMREAKEELGLDIRPDELIPIGSIHLQYEKEFFGELFCDNEVAFQYVYRGEFDISSLVFQESEVECAEWFGMDYILEKKALHDELFAAPIEDLILLKEYIDRTVCEG